MSLERIAFAACCKINFDSQQTVWTEMAAYAPHHLLLLGDQIYMDYKGDQDNDDPATGLIGYDLLEPATIGDAEFEAQMRLRYQLQFRVPSFQAVVRQVLAGGGQIGIVWDDHDFGFNNALGRLGGPLDDDPHYKGRCLSPSKQAISRRLFEEFRLSVLGLGGGGGYVQLPVGWAPATPGVYQKLSLNQVEVFLVDTRTFRQSPNPGPDASRDSAILGEAQWAWLQGHAGTTTKLALVASGSPLSSEGFLSDQSWKQAKRNMRPYREYTQLVALAQARATNGQRTAFIGGDRHTIEMIHDLPFLPEIVCAGSAAPKGLGSHINGRHFGLLDVDGDQFDVRLFKKGRVGIAQPLFGGGARGPDVDTMVA